LALAPLDQTYPVARGTGGSLHRRLAHRRLAWPAAGRLARAGRGEREGSAEPYARSRARASRRDPIAQRPRRHRPPGRRLFFLRNAPAALGHDSMDKSPARKSERAHAGEGRMSFLANNDRDLRRSKQTIGVNIPA